LGRGSPYIFCLGTAEKSFGVQKVESGTALKTGEDDGDVHFFFEGAHFFFEDLGS
jgi:hypothetical protein